MSALGDPADKALDVQAADNFGGVHANRRAGYTNPLGWALKQARKGGTLAAGEGKLIVEYYEGLLRKAFEEGMYAGDCEGLISSSQRCRAQEWNASAVRQEAGLPEVEVPEDPKRPSLFERMRDFDAGYSAHTVTFPIPPKEAR